MRRALAWMTGIVGVAALARLLHRRRHVSELPSELPAADPAEELRRALAEQRDVEPEAAPAAEEPSPDERRADVHARGESAIARMREGGDTG